MVNNDSYSMFTMVSKDNSVAIIDIETFGIIEFYKNFFGDSNQVVTPMGLCYSRKAKALCGLHWSNDKIFLTLRYTASGKNYCQSLQGILVESGESFYPMCLTTTLNEEYILVGGSNSKDPRMGTPKLVCLKLDQNFKFMDEVVLQDEPTRKMMTVSAITRTSQHRDIYAAGVYSNIYIIEWNGTNLAVLNRFLDAHSWLVSQLCCSNNLVFSSCKNDKFIRSERFDEPEF